MNKIFKVRLSKCFLYTLLCVCCFAFVYVIGWFISFDSSWVFEMAKNTEGRYRLVLMLSFTIALSYAVNKINEL